MDLFEGLSMFSRFFPRLTGLIVVVACLFFPAPTTRLIMATVQPRGEKIAQLMRNALGAQLQGAPDAAPRSHRR